MINIYFFNLIEIFFCKYISSIIYKYTYIILLLNNLFYYNLLIDLKNSMILKFNSLTDLTALHYPDLLNELELNYLILSYKLNFRFLLKFLIKKEDLIISLNEIYLNSNWLEREVWDMFGIKFIYHRDLRRILTDYGFIGHPLLKYFPLTGFYELRFDDIYNKIIKEFIELTQAYRFFYYINPWILWHR